MLIFRKRMSAGRKACFRAVLVAVALISLSSTAHANAGTPLMWATLGHLMLGNFFIGIAEGLLIGFVFKLGKVKAVLIMIGANYFSAWVGAFLVGVVDLYPQGLGLLTAVYYVWAGAVVMFAATLVLEWPLIFLLFKGRAGRFAKSIFATLLVQTLSYAAIIAWYASASTFSACTQTEFDPNLHFLKNRDAVIYFISEADGDVYRMRLDGSERRKVSELDGADKLFLAEGDAEGVYDLCVSRFDPDSGVDRKSVLLEAVAAVPEYARCERFAGSESSPEPLPPSWGTPMDWRAERECGWRYGVDIWRGSGLRANRSDSDEYIHVGFSTPILDLTVRSATVLPGDEVVFQFGSEILVFSTESRKIGVVARGSRPVVLIPEAQLPRGLSEQARSTAQGLRAIDNAPRQL